MKKIVRLTEQDINNMVLEALNEWNPINPLNGVFRNRPDSTYGDLNNKMGQSVKNGMGDDSVLAGTNGVYGQIYQNAQNNNVNYQQVLVDVSQKMQNYLKKGYFGRNPLVGEVVQKFIEHLNYMNGAYEAAISRQNNRMNAQPQQQIAEARIGRAEIGINNGNLNLGWTPRTNQFGVRQGSEGQWMTSLIAELQQLMNWQFLHGTKTIEATQKLIEFLQVKQNTVSIPLPFGRNKNNNGGAENTTNNGGGNNNSPNRKKAGIAAFIALAAMFAISVTPQQCNGIFDGGNTQQNNVEMSTQMNQNQTGNNGSTIEYQQASTTGQNWSQEQQNQLDQQRLNAAGVNGEVNNTGDNGGDTSYVIRHNGNGTADTLASFNRGSATMNEAIDRAVTKTLRKYLR